MLTTLIEKVHGSYVYPRRLRVLAENLAGTLPRNVRVLDVGCGDGVVDQRIMQVRPDVKIEGVEIIQRPNAVIPVRLFDGNVLPFTDNSYDVVMFVDVLHHTPDPMVLLREAFRVARLGVVLKDHNLNGFMAAPIMRFMDTTGNARFGIPLPFNFWKREQWQGAVQSIGAPIEEWRETFRLYPWWANWLFGRRMNFIARFGKPPGGSVRRERAVAAG